jgi:hypothetical protein
VSLPDPRDPLRCALSPQSTKLVSPLKQRKVNITASVVIGEDREVVFHETETRFVQNIDASYPEISCKKLACSVEFKKESDVTPEIVSSPLRLILTVPAESPVSLDQSFVLFELKDRPAGLSQEAIKFAAYCNAQVLRSVKVKIEQLYRIEQERFKNSLQSAQNLSRGIVDPAGGAVFNKIGAAFIENESSKTKVLGQLAEYENQYNAYIR